MVCGSLEGFILYDTRLIYVSTSPCVFMLLSHMLSLVHRICIKMWLIVLYHFILGVRGYKRVIPSYWLITLLLLIGCNNTLFLRGNMSYNAESNYRCILNCFRQELTNLSIINNHTASHIVSTANFNSLPGFTTIQKRKYLINIWQIFNK